jgi:hypothetical protein
MKITRLFLAALVALSSSTAAFGGEDPMAEVQQKLAALKQQLQDLENAQKQLQGGQGGAGNQAAEPVDPSKPTTLNPASNPKVFQYRMGTLRGRGLQPAGGLQTGGLQPAGGLQPSGADSGAGPVETRPMSVEMWRQLFPGKK